MKTCFRKSRMQSTRLYSSASRIFHLLTYLSELASCQEISSKIKCCANSASGISLCVTSCSSYPSILPTCNSCDMTAKRATLYADRILLAGLFNRAAHTLVLCACSSITGIAIYYTGASLHGPSLTALSKFASHSTR
jgi:hypothetical protein